MTLTTLPLVTTTGQYYSTTVTEPKVISTTFETSEETTTSTTLTALHTSPEIEQDCSQAIRLREMIAWALVFLQEYISSKSVQLLKTAFLHIDVTSASVNPISGGTSCTYVNHSLHRSFRQTNHIQPVPFKGPDSVVDS